MSGVNAKMLVHRELGHGFIQSHEDKARNKNASTTKIELPEPTVLPVQARLEEAHYAIGRGVSQRRACYN